MEALEKLAYSPVEFAALFGHEKTWAYRLIYSGKVRVIKDFGKTMIPAYEARNLLESAAFFADGNPRNHGRVGCPFSTA